MQQVRNILYTEAPTYAQARTQFLTAAEAAGAAVQEFEIKNAVGAFGEKLFVSTAYVGPAEPRRMILRLSGTHGIEGFSGSAAQVHTLKRIAEGEIKLAPDCGLMDVHMLNPYGASHLCRYTERGVDLNRNFVDHGKVEYPHDPVYDELYSAINPRDFTALSEFVSRLKVARFVNPLWFGKSRRFKQLVRAIAAGQWKYPNGVQFGGNAPEQSNLILRSIVRNLPQSLERLVAVDFHDGLPPGAKAIEEIGTIIVEYPVESPEYARVREFFGNVDSAYEAGTISTTLPHAGAVDAAIIDETKRLNPQTEVTVLCGEAGTEISLQGVVWMVRLRNWLRYSGKTETDVGRHIKAGMMRTFYPADLSWRMKLRRFNKFLFARALKTAEAPL